MKTQNILMKQISQLMSMIDNNKLQDIENDIKSIKIKAKIINHENVSRGDKTCSNLL